MPSFQPSNSLLDDAITSVSTAMSAALARNWWAIAIRGILGIVFGLTALLYPGATILSLALIFSAYTLADGVLAIVAAAYAAQRHERWALLVFEGLVDIATAAIAFFWPEITVVAFVLLLATWALLSGGFMLAAAFRLDVDHGRWWLAFSGLASVAYGILLIVAPLTGAVVLTWWLGAYAIVLGVSLAVLAFRLREQLKS